MTTDVVEKCARAAAVAMGVRGARVDGVWPEYVGEVVAVIDALADGVSDEMMDIAAKTLLVDPSRLSPGGVDELRRALSAAIRAAKSREG